MSPMYCEKFRIPKHLEIADGAVVPAPWRAADDEDRELADRASRHRS